MAALPTLLTLSRDFLKIWRTCVLWDPRALSKFSMWSRLTVKGGRNSQFKHLFMADITTQHLPSTFEITFEIIPMYSAQSPLPCVTKMCNLTPLVHFVRLEFWQKEIAEALVSCFCGWKCSRLRFYFSQPGRLGKIYELQNSRIDEIVLVVTTIEYEWSYKNEQAKRLEAALWRSDKKFLAPLLTFLPTQV